MIYMMAVMCLSLLAGLLLAFASRFRANRVVALVCFLAGLGALAGTYGILKIDTYEKQMTRMAYEETDVGFYNKELGVTVLSDTLAVTDDGKKVSLDPLYEVKSNISPYDEPTNDWLMIGLFVGLGALVGQVVHNRTRGVELVVTSLCGAMLLGAAVWELSKSYQKRVRNTDLYVGLDWVRETDDLYTNGSMVLNRNGLRVDGQPVMHTSNLFHWVKNRHEGGTEPEGDYIKAKDLFE